MKNTGSDRFRSFQNHKPKFYFSSAVLSAILIIYLIADYQGPDEILLRTDTIFGLKGYRAPELVVQAYNEEGDLYATRGMIIYKLRKGEKVFKKVAHVPTGFSIFWLRNFSLVRMFTLRPECMEVIVKKNGEITALSAGKIWHLTPGQEDFEPTLRLTHYGKGDQGIFENGIINSNDSTVFFGEYFRNEHRGPVRIFGSKDYGRTWEVKYTFPAGTIRHIHAIHKDPYDNKLWICAGDIDEEPRIGWSDDEFKTINFIGQGSQEWRVTQLLFTEKYLYWGADTYSNEHSGIYRWDRATHKLEKLAHVDGAVFHTNRLSDSTIVLTTNREGGLNEKDELTRIFFLKNDQPVRVLESGTWERNSPGFWFKYAKLRMPRNQGYGDLAITCLSQKEFPNGELLIVPTQSIQKTLQNLPVAN